MYSISFWGSSRVFSTSMNEERSLMPGGADSLSEVCVGEEADDISGAACGSGGGRG